MLPVGFGMVWWSDTLPSDKWMLSGGTLTPGTHDAAIAFFGGTALPDVKGRVIVGKDTGTAAFNALYRTGGAATHTLLTACLLYTSYKEKMKKCLLWPSYVTESGRAS